MNLLRLHDPTTFRVSRAMLATNPQLAASAWGLMIETILELGIPLVEADELPN
jgi:hypothetical protein